jgi:hypothetical protein
MEEDLPEDNLTEYCKVHEEYFDPHAYYEQDEINRMINEEGFILCPFCLDDITDGK